MSPFLAPSPNIFGVTPQTFSVIFAINGLGIIIATQVSGRLAGRVNETKLLVSELGLAAVSRITLITGIIVRAGLGVVLPSLFVLVRACSCLCLASVS